jgi:hypothetical protein
MSVVPPGECSSLVLPLLPAVVLLGGRLQRRHTSGSGVAGVVGLDLELLLVVDEGEPARWSMARTLSASWALVLALRPRLMPWVSMVSEQAQ